VVLRRLETWNPPVLGLRAVEAVRVGLNIIYVIRRYQLEMCTPRTNYVFLLMQKIFKRCFRLRTVLRNILISRIQGNTTQDPGIDSLRSGDIGHSKAFTAAELYLNLGESIDRDHVENRAWGTGKASIIRRNMEGAHHNTQYTSA
jgi:hypothetical protein